MEITKEILKESKIIHKGTTSYIMQYKNLTYKIYKGAFDYIITNTEYNLEEKETLNRLNYLVSKRKDITLTDLPSDLLTYNGKPVGVEITYYKKGITVQDYLKENYTEENVRLIKKQILKIIKELIENGIIPTDPHLENFLVCQNEIGSYEIKMIDTDDQYISVYPNNQRDVWYESEISTCYRVIDLSFENLANTNKGTIIK